MITIIHSFFSLSSLPPIAPLPSPFYLFPPSLKQHQVEWYKKKNLERLAFLTDPSVPPRHTPMSMGEKMTLDVLRECKYIYITSFLSRPYMEDIGGTG